MKNYVLGFMFNHAFRHPDSGIPQVVLIRKNKPASQEGKWNGVGGSIEPGEIPLTAMRREFDEEVGMNLDCWNYVTSFSDGINYRVFVFSIVDNVNLAKTMTGEKVSVFLINALPSNTMDNLDWLVPLCLARERGQWHPDHSPRMELDND